MIRIAFSTFLLITALVSTPVHSRSDVTKFEGVQERCVQVGKIEFGPKARWSNCSVVKGRWFATYDIVDLFQVQYCLGKGDGACDQKAFLVFANRAYTPKAKVILQRIDPGEAEYDDPLLVETKFGDILTLAARFPDGSVTKSYYRWKSGRWIPVEARGWLRELSKQLPKGVSAKGNVWPDADTMRVQVPISGESGASGAMADVELALAKDRFIVRKVQLESKLQ
ncbi:MAG: hypothetical protein HY661_02945 [Betaproteobacteria bacterium]|nr:hypothetical protein [Betaproteobacteria bacterium]